MAGLGTSSSGTTDIVSTNGYIWTLIISGVIFCTMHVQDLKDVSGDQARGRRSAPIVLGRRVTSWTIAIPVVLWSALCVWFWEASLPVASAPILLGLSVAWRCVNMSGKPADRRTWQLWCAWTAILYIIPPLSG
jgi:4-hydroxybenzoate polyprenyltransferase